MRNQFRCSRFATSVRYNGPRGPFLSVVGLSCPAGSEPVCAADRRSSEVRIHGQSTTQCRRWTERAGNLHRDVRVPIVHEGLPLPVLLLLCKEQHERGDTWRIVDEPHCQPFPSTNDPLMNSPPNLQNFHESSLIKATIHELCMNCTEVGKNERIDLTLQ